MRVNASSPSAALGNVGGGSLSAPPSGGGGGGGASPVSVSAPAPVVPQSAAGSYGGQQGTWSTVNGPRTVPQMAAELAGVGYNGPTDPGSILMAYQRTTGGSVGAGTGAAGGTGQGVPTTAPGVDLSGLEAAFNAAGTMSQKDLDERKREFDANLAFQQQQMQQEGIPQVVINQKLAQLQQDEFLFQSAMAQQQTALDALKTAATLGGPENFVQAANYARGVRATDVPAFMTNLLSGTGAPAATGGVGLSAPQTFSGLASKLGGTGTGVGGPGTPQDTTDLGRTLAMGQKLFTAGGSALAPQALEGLSDTETKMLGSIANAVGGDLPSFLRTYAASRIGQGSAQAA